MGRIAQSETRAILRLSLAADRRENSPKDSRIEPLNLVGTRSTASPYYRTDLGRGGTRPYQGQEEVHGEGNRRQPLPKEGFMGDPLPEWGRGPLLDLRFTRYFLGGT